jgi:hypothetical protein
MEFVSIRIQEVERFGVAAEIWQLHDRLFLRLIILAAPQ